MIDTGGYKTIAVNRDSRGVLSVILNRPEVRNAFNPEVIEELSHFFSSPETLSNDVRAIVLRGNGKVFCAGADLNWMRESVDFSYDQNLNDARRLAGLFALMNEFSKPVIGVVHGAAIGGGVGLVSVCDIAIASEDTVFSLSEARLGIIPACIGPFVIAKIGASQARKLFISAERFNSKKAKELGLVHELVSGEADLDRALNNILESILLCGPMAVSAAKKLVLDISLPERRGKNSDCLEHVSRALAEIRVSKEGQEGVRAFLEKRQPSWLDEVSE